MLLGGLLEEGLASGRATAGHCLPGAPKVLSGRLAGRRAREANRQDAGERPLVSLDQLHVSRSKWHSACRTAAAAGMAAEVNPTVSTARPGKPS